MGIPIYVDASWAFIFLLITWTLKLQFSQEYAGWAPEKLWTAALVTSLIFFGSVVFHELSHSAVALHYKIRVTSITLFIFGGLARIGREPSKAIQEFNIAVAGPLASFFLAGVFLAVTRFFPSAEAVKATASWLWIINLELALFNLLPGFPLDGGRIFRAMVWAATKDFSRATRIAAGSGKLVAYGMVAVGVWYLTRSEWVSGGWLVLIGWFLLNAAHESVAQATIKDTLTGLCAFDVMSREVPTISGGITLEDYGAEVLRTGCRSHIVLTDDRLVGLMNVRALNSVSRDEWPHTSVQAIMIPRDKILWAAPDEPLLRLLERLLAADVNQMPIVSGAEQDDAHIVGMVTRDSILRVMQARAELGRFSMSK
jgi:Zn-dependent protease